MRSAGHRQPLSKGRAHEAGAPSPFTRGRHLLKVALQGRRIGRSERKPTHLVFLADTSGSMSAEDRLPLAQRAMKLMVDGLNETDTVALVTYAGSVRDVLPPTPASERARIFEAIDALTSGGGTAMGSGMELAYRHAVKKAGPNAVARVVVLTDGDTNLGPNQGADAMLESVRPFPSSPGAGESFFGHPFDPVLASVHRQLGDGRLGDFSLDRADAGSYGIVQTNEWMKRRDEEPFRSCILFGSVPSLAYFYAVVPKLADAQGRQPVLYIDNHDERVVLPIASTVDRFFETYSRYLEVLVRAPDYAPGEFWAVAFPWGVPELIARDRPLVELLTSGRFEGLMTTAPAEREWVEQVKSARP